MHIKPCEHFWQALRVWVNGYVCGTVSSMLSGLETRISKKQCILKLSISKIEFLLIKSKKKRILICINKKNFN